METPPVLQWRKFEFFSIVEEADNGVLASLLKPGHAITAACSGRGLILVGDSGGFVHSVARALHSPVPSFPAHDAPVSWMWAADAASVLVTMAHPASGGTELKVWAPDKLQADQPVLLRLLRPDPRPPSRSGAPQPPSSTVTAAAVHPNLNMLALGFSCGAIMLYRGELGGVGCLRRMFGFLLRTFGFLLRMLGFLLRMFGFLRVLVEDVWVPQGSC
ncbi:hypothetical protein FHG87_015699 [Trinorchestia longiramus]|nr:hypothetical protein FHG87_015699 [Trinorchestia longiramus]